MTGNHTADRTTVANHRGSPLSHQRNYCTAATHTCVPWHLTMKLPHKLHVVVVLHRPDGACPSYQTMQVLKPSANMCILPIQVTAISSSCSASLALRCLTRIRLQRLLEAWILDSPLGRPAEAVGCALLRVWLQGAYAPPGGERSTRLLHGSRIGT